MCVCGQGDGSSLFVTDEQKQWQAIQKLITNLKPLLKKREPNNPCRKAFFKVAVSRWFDNLIMVLITINTLALCIGFYGQPYRHVVVLDSLFAVSAKLRTKCHC